ncbi:MAG: SUMF1/EgtB/PvdO family nonheme iron enzyme [candidate division Zixibacteria bacterium]|nr:SUMF1/EgtB/PvdO family nonheme iron enzyme [Candidatus Tariuqbacter arcticus]
MKIISSDSIIFLFSLTLFAGTPTVSNVTASQLPGTEIVQITYDLEESEGLPCWIFVFVDRDDWGSWNVPVYSLIGDVGPNIMPGAGKSIQWNAGLDYDHHYVPNCVVKVVAQSLEDGVPEDMALIPAGEYTMGSSVVGGTAIPEHAVYLDAYWIDKYEVTNYEYKLFCDETGTSYPSDPGFSGMSNYFINYPDYPVVKVTWYNAQAYATWAGKRLLTEAEWERAAKGTTNQTNRLWPWGDSFNALIGGTTYHANITGTEDGWQYTAPVGTFPTGVSPAGCYDMAGNVWEWCSDWYDSGYYSFQSLLQSAGACKRLLPC